MKALRVQVERVVRPIQASQLRKNRMREELLAHLTALFDQELAQGSDVHAAQAKAIERFGDVRSLTQELQSCVPWFERWALYSIPHSGPIRRRPDELSTHYLLRANVWAWAISTAGYASIVLAVSVVRHWQPHRANRPSLSTLVGILAAVSVLQLVIMVARALLSEAIRRGLQRRSSASTTAERHRETLRILCYVAASSTWVGATAGAVILLIESVEPLALVTPAQFWWITLGTIAIGVPLTLIEFWNWKASIWRFENWDSLDLDDQPSLPQEPL